MNAGTIGIVRETWRAVAPIADDAMALFYGRLFAIDPSTRPLFTRADMAAQRAKLAQSITMTVDGLDQLEAFVPVLADLGRRHRDYGVEDAHYDSVGAALLWTLEHGLGAAWTPAAEHAWTEAYGAIAGIMRRCAQAAHKEEPTAA